jgi:hypothetical protein
MTKKALLLGTACLILTVLAAGCIGPSGEGNQTEYGVKLIDPFAPELLDTEKVICGDFYDYLWKWTPELTEEEAVERTINIYRITEDGLHATWAKCISHAINTTGSIDIIDEW